MGRRRALSCNLRWCRKGSATGYKKPTIDAHKLVGAFMEFGYVAIVDGEDLLKLGVPCKGTSQPLEPP